MNIKDNMKDVSEELLYEMKFKRKIEICLHPEKARLLEKYVKYNTSEKPQPNPQADRLKAALKRDRASLRSCFSVSGMPFDYMDDMDDFDWPDFWYCFLYNRNVLLLLYTVPIFCETNVRNIFYGKCHYEYVLGKLWKKLLWKHLHI